MVIAIIGILASIVMVSLTGAKQKSRDSKRIADIKTIQLTLETYYNDNLGYPLGIYGGQLTNYISAVPADTFYTPACTTGTQAGCYKYVPLGTTGSQACSPLAAGYHLGAVLEQAASMSATQAHFAASGYDCTSYTGNDFNGNTKDCGTGSNSTPLQCYDVTN